MTESEFLIAISTLAREIDLLRYQNQQLETANRNLTEQLESLHIEVRIHNGGAE